MAKLYFRHGTVSSAKTLNLLAVAHTYRTQGKKVLLLKPAIDTRFGLSHIRSRSGLEAAADMLIHPHSILKSEDFEGVSCAIVDEVQFASISIVEQLRELTINPGVPVLCYGLRTDFRGQLFPASQRLFELADMIEEIKTTCAFCNSKAVFNLKHSNGVATLDGPAVDLGADEKYFPACFRCYRDQLNAAGYKDVCRSEYLLPFPTAAANE